MNRYEFTTEQRELLESLAQPLAIYQFVDKRIVTLALSQGFCDLLGYDDRAQAYADMDNDMYKHAHPDDVARIADAALRFAAEGGTYEVIYRTKLRGGDDYRIIHAIGKHVYTDDGVCLAHVWYTDEGEYTDGEAGQRTELNRALNRALHEESLMRASYYDQLTGLPSMTYFFELAEAAKKTIQREGGQPVLLFMDLSGMKYFNAQNGFSEGDKLLRAFAKQLSNVFGNESCCHIGSDHFAAFAKEDGIQTTLKGFISDCRMINDGNNLPVRIGVYSCSLEDVPVSVACDRAKFACDSLRNVYESGSCFFEQGLRDDEERRRYVVTNLDKAIEEQWIQVFYQPIIRAVNGRVCDEEALARWIDPNLGMLSPNDFIPALEDAGVIYKLDLYVVEQMLQKIKLQEKIGLDIVPHSVNLSRSDFESCDIVEEICKRVDSAGVSRNLVTIEITESIIGSDSDFIKAQIERIRKLGFPVWMDDFGSGYSAIDLLQSMEFDLIKFDLSFMQRLNKEDKSRIVLTELMRMVTSLGIETLCEGVETEEQVQFLREIGCAKLQGFYFCRPISHQQVFERYETGIQIGFENPEESAYFEAIGRVNLFDLTVIASGDDALFQNYFNTLPMSIVEIDGDDIDFVRTNQSYRDFIKRFFKVDLEANSIGYSAAIPGPGMEFVQLVRQCCEEGNRAFFDETMPDGSIVHAFARRVSVNPVSGKKAAAVAVLSVTEPNEGATYASIARALAADFYNIYYVDLDTDQFIEYTSPVGGEALAMERHGEGFFESAKRDTMTRLYKKDRERFLANFTKENIINELDRQGVFTLTYRLVDSGKPMYVSMKITRMRSGSNQIIMGINIIDSQMRQQELLDRMQHEKDAFARVMALSDSYLSLYIVDIDTGNYIECIAKGVYKSIGLPQEGEDFFGHSIINGEKVIYPDDFPMYKEQLTEENVMNAISEFGVFNLQYRLKTPGEPISVNLRIAKVKESDGEKLIAGVSSQEPE